MNRNPDRETVVRAITDGIGVRFGAATRRSFFAQLERLECHPEFIDAELATQQTFIDILAVACFFQTVIVPIESSGTFVGVLKQAGATHLRVAGEQLGPAYAYRANAIAEGFRVLLQRTNISESLLTYGTLSEFMAQIREHRNDDDSVD